MSQPINSSYVLQADLYNKLSLSKVIQEASLRSGITRGSINAAWDAIGEVIKAWATESHSVAVPGLGTMRFGLRSKSVGDVNEVGTELITTRRVIFTPNVDIKDELKRTSINITCYDRNGNVVKRVTSSDDAEIEDNETVGSNGNENENGGSQTQNSGTDNSGSGSNGNQNNTDNSGSGSTTGGGSDNTGSSTGSETGGTTGGDNTGGGSGSGDNTGGDDDELEGTGGDE